jgi:predicted nucleic acid-binding protein
VLALAERKGRITPAHSAEFIADLSIFDIEVDTESVDRAFDHLLPLCRQYQLTSYDAVYLDLALRRHLPLATLDEALRIAGSKLGVQLLGK